MGTKPVCQIRHREARPPGNHQPPEASYIGPASLAWTATSEEETGGQGRVPVETQSSSLSPNDWNQNSGFFLKSRPFPAPIPADASSSTQKPTLGPLPPSARPTAPSTTPLPGLSHMPAPRALIGDTLKVPAEQGHLRGPSLSDPDHRGPHGASLNPTCRPLPPQR